MLNVETKEMILQHIEQIDEELRKKLGNSIIAELLKAKSTALLSLATLEGKWIIQRLYVI